MLFPLPPMFPPICFNPRSARDLNYELLQQTYNLLTERSRLPLNKLISSKTYQLPRSACKLFTWFEYIAGQSAIWRDVTCSQLAYGAYSRFTSMCTDSYTIVFTTMSLPYRPPTGPPTRQIITNDEQYQLKIKTITSLFIITSNLPFVVDLQLGLST